MDTKLEGGCTCGAVRYRLNRMPMITHCCHCTWCQRETGSAFVINTLIEMSEVDLLGEAPVIKNSPSLSGKGQLIARCPHCHVAVWSHYSNAREVIAFVRAGTLDDKTVITPDVHIFTSTKVAWIDLNDGKPAYAEYYANRDEVWPKEAQARWTAARNAHPPS